MKTKKYPDMLRGYWDEANEELQKILKTETSRRVYTDPEIAEKLLKSKIVATTSFVLKLRQKYGVPNSYLRQRKLFAKS